MLTNRSPLARCAAILIVSFPAGVSADELSSSAVARPFNGVELKIVQAPSPAVIDGQETLVHELHVTNLSSTVLRLRTIEVIDGSGRVLLKLAPSQAARTLPTTAGTSGSRVEPGRRSVVYAEMPWFPGQPGLLRHRVTFDVVTANGSESFVVVGGDTAVDQGSRPKLGAPLRGGPWAAVYAPEMDFGHRRQVYTLGGTARVPGRMAIDWMPAKGFDRTSAGSVAAADGTGSDVLAVANATVVVAKEAPTAGEPPSIDDETGAMVVLDLGNHRFAFYEHVAPQLLVKVGQKVKKGQLIARLGSTGHVTQPHLHFHVANGSKPLSSEGMPYVLTDGRVVGRYASIGAFAAGERWAESTPRPIAGLPPPNAVVRFR